MLEVHQSVLLGEVLENIVQSEGGAFLDLTFGEGGHSERLLESGAGRVVGVDRDFSAIAKYMEWGTYRADPRLKLVHSRFSKLDWNAYAHSMDGIVMDLGVSTRQLLEAERGFSFSNPGPLDMRMDGHTGQTLADYLSSVDAFELARALEVNAEIKHSNKVAEKILAAWNAGELKTTGDLAHLVGGPVRPGRKHPATVIFMALRMAVNEELSEIQECIPQALTALIPGGRLAVITFHSVEDRMVKRLFQRLAGKCTCGLGAPLCKCPTASVAEILTQHPIAPSRDEILKNPRSRSAKLRVLQKT